MSSTREPIGVIGTGYVGLVTAAGFAELGNEVWCIDIDAHKIERLEQGEIPIYEPGLAELVAKHRGRLHFSTDITDALEHARLLFVAVGTPPTYSGDADLSAVHAVVGSMPPSDRHALVMKSTVPGRHGHVDQALFVEQGKPGFRYVSCPEFLKEGSAIADFLHPDRVVVGDDGDWAGDAVVELYRPLLKAQHGGRSGELVRTDIASAEMVKLAANAFLATKISFINEIANVCEVTGANVTEVSKGIGLDDRIGPKFLQPGIGFGGSCFPKDVSALKQLAGNSGYHFQLLNAVIEVNELQKRRVIGKLHKHLGSLVGKRIALLGLAFKPNTDDMREASSLVLGRPAAGRRRQGRRAYDPIAEEEARDLMSGVDFADGPLDAARDADAVVLVTEWDEFRTLDWRERGRRDVGHRRSSTAATPWTPPRSAPPGWRTRASAGASPVAGRHPRRRGGDAPAPPHLDGAQAGRAARRPAVHRLHARVAAPPRRGRRDHVLRVQGRAHARGPRRRVAVRPGPAVRRGARAARHGRGAQGGRGAPAGPLPHAQRRRPDRHRPVRADRPSRGHRRARHAGPRAGGRPDRLRPGPSATTTARSRSSSRSRAPTRSTRT